jgi:hypothetical protein
VASEGFGGTLGDRNGGAENDGNVGQIHDNLWMLIMYGGLDILDWLFEEFQGRT